jgi:hypothetical protein
VKSVSKLNHSKFTTWESILSYRFNFKRVTIQTPPSLWLLYPLQRQQIWRGVWVPQDFLSLTGSSKFDEILQSLMWSFRIWVACFLLIQDVDSLLTFLQIFYQSVLSFSCDSDALIHVQFINRLYFMVSHTWTNISISKFPSIFCYHQREFFILLRAGSSLCMCSHL